ncbi:carboxylate-amine ligase [Microbacterium sp.]|uniref:carboxylate-amine ligase n=1 Tax=Microbacterium sp. TaxID=51671 RepID=UPI003C7516D0
MTYLELPTAAQYESREGLPEDSREQSHAATFGMEEEFVLLDPRSLRTVDLGLDAVDELASRCPGLVAREFFPSQIEFATPVCTTSDEALQALLAFRGELAAWAQHAGVIVAAAGTPFLTAEAVAAWRGRYALIAGDIAGLAPEHQLNGLHVHVGIPDRDAGVRASNFVRPWLPVLLALSANSPFWQGHDTGFASWRAIHSRRWTTHSTPPFFADAAEYDEALERLAGVGATSDAGTINWHARLSRSHPTLEVRVCDAQLEPTSSVALAVIIRALVVMGFARDTPRPQRYEGWDAAQWHAARHGMTDSLVDPWTGHPVPAVAVADALRELIGAQLQPGEDRIVDGFLADLCRLGTGAARQRRAHQRGRLAELYRAQVAGG